MKLLRSFPLAGGLLLGLGLFLANPSSAAAAEVMCANDFGSCTISNDNQSWITCSCDDLGGTEGTGGDEWDGLTEAELLEICLDHVAFCSEFGGDGDGDPTDGTTGGDPTDGTTGGDPTDGTTGSEGSSDGGEGSSDGGEGATTGDGGEGATTGDGGEGATTGDGGDSGDSGGGETSGDGGQATGDGGGEAADDETGGAEDETGTPADEVEGGGNCSVASNSGFGLLGLALLGLFGLHRREQRELA